MRPRRTGLQARRSLLTLLVLTAVACAPAATAPPMNQTAPLQTLPKPVTPPLPPAVSPLVTSMLTGLADYMVSVYAENRDLIPNNPGLATWIRAKMAMLESPTLINDIFSGRRWIDGEAPTAPGGPTPIAAVFALESMREECADVVRIVERHLPVLAEFFDERFPTGAMKIWYGFKTGATGGGAMYLVDRGTQDQFRLPSSLSYEAMLAHEAAHSYIGNEALTQFLEVYTYNVARGAGVDHHGWTELRGWTPDTPSVFGVTYVLDVYHRVGFDVMRRGFRAIRPLRPGYGMPLSPFVIAAFLNEVPEEHRAFVQERLSRIIA